MVANEVRALAQRSAEAAKGIKALIDTSSSQVSEGVSLVLQTGAALKGIMGEVSDIGRSVQGIASAVDGNATDLGQVKDTLGMLDSSTQQNAAMAEESNAALRALSSATDGLMRVVGRFHRAGANLESGDLLGTSAFQYAA